MRRLSFAVRGDFHAFGQRIGDADTHAVQAAGEAVGAAAAFVKLTARMQPGKHEFDHRGFFLWVHTKRNTAPVVVYADGAIGKQGDSDFFAVTGQRFIGGVVDDFLDDVQRVVGAGVHAGSLLDRLESFENAYRPFGIFGLFGCHGEGL